MPSNRGSNRKAQKPRRTHNLGGCATCRRRHVKCDQARPQCGVCRSAGLECGGFPATIRWASLSTGPKTGKGRGTSAITPTRNEEPENSQDLEPGYAQNRSIEIVRDDHDVQGHSKPMSARSRTSVNAPNGPWMVPEQPPFGQYDVESEPVPSATGSDLIAADQHVASYALPNVQPMDWNWLFEGSNGLGWNDIFHDSMPLYPPNLPESVLDGFELQQQPLIGLNQDWVGPLPSHDYSLASSSAASREHEINAPQILQHVIDRNDHEGIEEYSLLEDAKYLLQHFRDEVIPKFSPVPMTCRSPWEVMNWRAAIQTHADMTYLESKSVTCASKTNLFAILGCSAYSVVKGYPHRAATMSVERAQQILDYAYPRAKKEMQESLKLELLAAHKAKYKDQLMAIISLIALTTHMGLTSSARCYLIDAERLVRLRGLAKREVSRHCRLLHHVYTWLRIIGESTFVLHDHKSKAFQTRIESMLTSCDDLPSNSPVSDRSRTATREYSELDDFLRIDTHAPDSESDADGAKDQETGFRDIHLADPRQWSQTLYMEVYGIPEIWLSLVSQVTRIANITDYLANRSEKVPPGFATSLERKLGRLENKICSFAARYSTVAAFSENDNGLEDAKTTTAHRAMLRAMSSALVIFFYRRLRKVNPWILQAHVNDIISALKDFDQSKNAAESSAGTVGTPWPAFIAGCEAMAPESRQWLLKWIAVAAERSTSSGLLDCSRVMKRVWELRDGINNPSRDNGPDLLKGHQVTWVGVLRDEKLWLMLY